MCVHSNLSQPLACSVLRCVHRRWGPLITPFLSHMSKSRFAKNVRKSLPTMTMATQTSTSRRTMANGSASKTSSSESTASSSVDLKQMTFDANVIRSMDSDDIIDSSELALAPKRHTDIVNRSHTKALRV